MFEDDHHEVVYGAHDKISTPLFDFLATAVLTHVARIIRGSYREKYL